MTHALHYRQPVRRDSFDVDDPRANVFRPIQHGMTFVDSLLQVFDEWDDLTKRKGHRHAMGQNCRKVLRALFRCCDFEKGVCEPSLDALMRKTRFARATIVRALKLLWANGFIEWIRRTEKTGNAPGNGPSVRQVSNAYWFDTTRLPARAFKRLRELLERKGKIFQPKPLLNPKRFIGMRERRADRLQGRRIHLAATLSDATPLRRAELLYPGDPDTQRAYLAMLDPASSATSLNPSPIRSIQKE